MDRLPILKKNHPQVPAIRLRNPGPEANPAISLHRLGLGVRNHTLYPLVPNPVAVGAVSYVGEVLREFHFWSILNPVTVVEARVAECSDGDSRQPTARSLRLAAQNADY